MVPYPSTHHIIYLYYLTVFVKYLLSNEAYVFDDHFGKYGG